jgi:transposase
LEMVSLSLRSLRRLVFVDESGFHIAMDRLRARAPKGKRAYGKVPRNRGKNLTLVASMSLSGMGEAMCIEGSTDANPFEVYIEHFLAPRLEQGQVVVFDKLGAHKPQRVRELIEARGAEVLFLPSYSPDLNPIEEAFSKIKQLVRKVGARTHEALTEAIAQALSAITPLDAAGWFNHCGYQVEVQYL